MPNDQIEKSSTGQGKMLRTLRGEAQSIPPIWLMRQAGRYLPEYRATRTKAQGFLNLCYTPELATEVTLQPIRRFDFDAAILFSDILVVPHALGQDVWFVEGEGPRLAPIATPAEFDALDQSNTARTFDLVCEAVTRIRTELSSDKALIGFCGAPWTVATYMVAGRGTTDQAPARLLAYGDPGLAQALIDLLVETSITYLSRQIQAGVNIVQIFDSWAGSLPDDQLERWVVDPTRRMIDAIRAHHPDVPIIGFPRAAGTSAVRYITQTGVDAIGCDTAMSLGFMRDTLAPTGVTLQGNLDPLLLVSGGAAMEARIAQILDAMRGLPFVFNLGHGIVPQTPPEHVATLVEVVRSHKKS